MNPNVAKSLLVAKVLVADGMMQDEERAFLDTVMNSLGLTADERKAVTELDGMDEAHKFALALPKEERQQIVEMLVDAASVDGKLSQYEMGVVKRLTKTLEL
jgi:uncharacterized tellurite resistance protein B-like protein